VGSFELAEKALYETQFPLELVMNYDTAKFKAFLAQNKAARKNR